MTYDFTTLDGWDRFYFDKKVLVVHNLVIINDYIDYENALMISYSFN